MSGATPMGEEQWCPRPRIWQLGLEGNFEASACCPVPVGRCCHGPKQRRSSCACAGGRRRSWKRCPASMPQSRWMRGAAWMSCCVSSRTGSPRSSARLFGWMRISCEEETWVQGAHTEVGSGPQVPSEDASPSPVRGHQGAGRAVGGSQGRRAVTTHEKHDAPGAGLAPAGKWDHTYRIQAEYIPSVAKNSPFKTMACLPKQGCGQDSNAENLEQDCQVKGLWPPCCAFPSGQQRCHFSLILALKCPHVIVSNPPLHSVLRRGPQGGWGEHRPQVGTVPQPHCLVLYRKPAFVPDHSVAQDWSLQ